MNYCE